MVLKCIFQSSNTKSIQYFSSGLRLFMLCQITVEKTVLEQANSKYELQGEYVLPGSRDRYPVDKESGGFLKMVMAGHLGSAMSSMGRWRMRLEVPGAEVFEMLPLARLLSRSTDPAVQSRSKVTQRYFRVYLWLLLVLGILVFNLDVAQMQNYNFRTSSFRVCRLWGFTLKAFVTFWR